MAWGRRVRRFEKEKMERKDSDEIFTCVLGKRRRLTRTHAHAGRIQSSDKGGKRGKEVSMLTADWGPYPYIDFTVIHTGN